MHSAGEYEGQGEIESEHIIHESGSVGASVDKRESAGKTYTKGERGCTKVGWCMITRGAGGDRARVHRSWERVWGRREIA